MGEVLLGALVLVATVLLLRAFVGADPKLLIRLLRYTGAGLLGLLAAGLFLTDRVGVAVFVASAAWGLFTRGHLWPNGWPHYNFSGRGTAKNSSGQSTGVRTAWIELELDHDSGAMRGTILKGAMAGRQLTDLRPDDLLAFYREAAADDAETARLLEAYLDRTLGPDWRQAAPGDQAPPERATAGMSRTEALKVLGLDDGASEADIRAAHRKLMLQNHPDRGGSDYLASKINEAKDVLLPG